MSADGFKEDAFKSFIREAIFQPPCGPGREETRHIVNRHLVRPGPWNFCPKIANESLTKSTSPISS
jgi:hypothetical protein